MGLSRRRFPFVRRPRSLWDRVANGLWETGVLPPDGLFGKESHTFFLSRWFLSYYTCISWFLSLDLHSKRRWSVLRDGWSRWGHTNLKWHHNWSRQDPELIFWAKILIAAKLKSVSVSEVSSTDKRKHKITLYNSSGVIFICGWTVPLLMLLAVVPASVISCKAHFPASPHPPPRLGQVHKPIRSWSSVWFYAIDQLLFGPTVNPTLGTELGANGLSARGVSGVPAVCCGAPGRADGFGAAAAVAAA